MTDKFIYVPVNVINRINLDDLLASKKKDMEGKHNPFTFKVTVPGLDMPMDLKCHIYNAVHGKMPGPFGLDREMVVFEGFVCNGGHDEPVRGWLFVNADPSKDGTEEKAPEGSAFRSLGFEVVGMIQIRSDPRSAAEGLKALSNTIKDVIDSLEAKGKPKPNPKDLN